MRSDLGRLTEFFCYVIHFCPQRLESVFLLNFEGVLENFLFKEEPRGCRPRLTGVSTVTQCLTLRPTTRRAVGPVRKTCTERLGTLRGMFRRTHRGRSTSLRERPMNVHLGKDVAQKVHKD